MEDDKVKETDDSGSSETKVVGKKFDGSVQLTVSLALGAFFIIIGAIVSFYFGSKNSAGFYFGIPLVITGFAIPALLFFGWRE